MLHIVLPTQRSPTYPQHHEVVILRYSQYSQSPDLSESNQHDKIQTNSFKLRLSTQMGVINGPSCIIGGTFQTQK